MTHQQKLLDKKVDGAMFTNKTPQEVVSMAEEQKFKQIMLIGGMELVTSFMKEDLIDEIWLSVHPILIGNGLSIMDKFETFKNLTF